MSTPPARVGVLAGAILSGTSLLYATLGETIVERAGIVNLGLEGILLIGASVGFAVAAATGSAWWGLPAAAAAGGLANLLFGWLVVSRRANQLASGLAMMFFGIGVSALVGARFVGAVIVGLPRWRPSVLAVPALGEVVDALQLRRPGLAARCPVAVLVCWVLFGRAGACGVRAVGREPDGGLRGRAALPRSCSSRRSSPGGVLGGVAGARTFRCP